MRYNENQNQIRILMALLATSCCLNLSNSNPPSLPSKPTQLLPRHGAMGIEKWRKECTVGMACCCMMIGIEVGSLGDASSAVVQDMRLPLAIKVTDLKQGNYSNNKVARWSDKRMCPPWHLNSLETIVPENLPRPSARRRWETVKNAPVVKETSVRGSSSKECFSL